MSLRDELAEGECDSDSYHVTKSEADEYNAGLDKETRQGESQQVTGDDSSKEHQRRSTRLIKTGADGTNFPRVVEVDDALAFITPQGEVYGFVDKDGNIQHEIIMKLTEEQKKITPSQKFWEMQEKGKKQVELWQQQPMTLEEVNQMMAERKAFLQKNLS